MSDKILPIELAEEIVRKIFECGKECGATVTRIQLMSQTGDGREIGLGGFGGAPLTSFIRRVIEDHLAANPEPSLSELRQMIEYLDKRIIELERNGEHGQHTRSNRSRLRIPRIAGIEERNGGHRRR